MAKAPDPPPFEIPDLDLVAMPRPAKAAPARPQAAPAALDLDEDGFELESVQASLGFGMDMDDEVAVSGARRASAQVDTAAWPSGTSPQAHELTIEPEEIERKAEYGSASGPIFLAPAYAWRVLSRRRALAVELSQTSAALSAAEASRDEALSALVRSVRAELEKHPQFAAGLREVDEAAQAKGLEDRALATSNAEVSTRLSAIDSQIAELGRELEQLSAVAAERQRALEDAEANVKRAEARVKRVQIEIRSIHDVATKRAAPILAKNSAAPIELSVEETARVSALNEQQVSLAAELEQVKLPHLAAQRELKAVQQQQGAIQQRIKQQEQQKSSFTRNARQELESKGQNASRAGARSLHAYGELGRALLAARGRVPVAEALLERVRQADAEVARAARQHELTRVAHGGFDRERAKQGLMLVSAALGLLLLLVLYALW